jgi:multiple sugar transport system ATP-binding protein
MQLGTPDAIYNRPAALFVAGFTGAPPMNLSDATLVGDAVDVGGTRLMLPLAMAARARGAGALKLGVRPEKLSLVPVEGAQRLACAVSLFEPLGAETLVTLRIGDTEWVARAAADFRMSPGSAVDVFVRPDHLHLFDAGSGAALTGD